MSDQLSGVSTEGMSPVSEPVQPVQSSEPNQQNVSQPVIDNNVPAGIDDNTREGFISAVQAEREKARIEAQKAEFYKQQYEESIRQQAYAPPVQQQTAPKYNPDEIPDIRTVEQILEDKMNVILQQNQQTQRQAWISAKESEARQKYSDYDDVVQKAMEMAEFLDPGYKAAILNSNNPAEMAYFIGKQHPDYKLTQEKQFQSQSTLAAIQNNAQKPPTLSQIKDGGSVQQQAGFYKNMPSNEWQAKLAEIKARS